jgi:hypothetical protein
MNIEELKRLEVRDGDLVVYRDAQRRRAECFADADNRGNTWVAGCLLRGPAGRCGNRLERGDIEVLEVWRPAPSEGRAKKVMQVWKNGGRGIHSNMVDLSLLDDPSRYDLYVLVEPIDPIMEQIKALPDNTWFEAVSDDGHRQVWLAWCGGYASGVGRDTQTAPNPRWVKIIPLKPIKKKKEKGC